jgi:TonB family protein
MDAKRTRRLLIVAFALSLLIHAVMAIGVHWNFREPANEVQVVHVQRLRPSVIARVPTPPPPTPRPKPVPTRIPAAPRPAAKPVGKPSLRGIRPAGGHSVAVSPRPAATAAATVAPTVAPCGKTDTPARVTAAPTPPDIAPQARADATNGTTKVQVTLDPSGAVENASVIQTSGNPSLDLVALEMAKSAAYAPAYHDCKAIASTYDFSARFVAW